MKRLFLLLASLALILPSAVQAADFEGTVHMKITSNKKVVDLDYQVKGGLIRTVIPTGKGDSISSILDTNAGTVTILIPAQKMYMVRPLPIAKTPLNHPNLAGGDRPVVSDGETKTILGYKCTKFTAPSAEGINVQAWVTTDLGSFAGFGGGGMGGRGGAAQEWAKGLQGQGFFPLLVISQDSAGNEKSRMEVTAVDKTALPDSTFQPPAGYTKFDMGGMMGGAMAHP